MSASVEMAAATHRGVLRACNEDCVAAHPSARFAVLADGMGGHNAGEVASRMAVDLISDGIAAATRGAHRRLDARGAEALIGEQIAHANSQIYETSRHRGEYAGMGTTVVVALWHDGHVSVGHVGDSRFYRLRSGVLEQLTRDHSLAQQRVDEGSLSREDARTAPIRNILTRAVGSDSQVSADLSSYDARAGDVFLLCSDGLTEMLTDERIAEILAIGARGLEATAAELIQRANERGGVDNISVILVSVGKGQG